MPYERKDQVVVATAPDGEVIAFGLLPRTAANALVEEIQKHGGWRAEVPLFGPGSMWPSSLEAKGERS